MNKRIAIFPGHVGKDSGAIDKVEGHESDDLMTIEAVINAQVAVLLKNRLDQYKIDGRIIVGSFKDRIALSENSDLGISIHADASTNKDARGYTIFHYPSSDKGKDFAHILDIEMNCFVGKFIKSRGVQAHNYYILRKTKFPCVLLEMGFLTNVIDERCLNLFEVQNMIAHSILNSILKFDEKG